MNSLGSLHLTLSTEVRRRTGNYVVYPHPLISDQCLLYWLTRRFWLIIKAQVASCITDQRNSRLLVYLIICLYDQLCAAVGDCNRVEICLPEHLYGLGRRTRR